MTRPYWDGKQDPREFIRNKALTLPVLDWHKEIARIESDGLWPDGTPRHIPAGVAQAMKSDTWGMFKTRILSEFDAVRERREDYERMGSLCFTDLIGRLSWSWAGTAVSEEQVGLMERTLDLSFSQEYRSYLMLCGRLLIPGFDMGGADGLDRLDVITLTKDARRELDIPGQYYVLSGPLSQDSTVAFYLQDRSDCVFAVIPDSSMAGYYIEPEYETLSRFLADVWFSRET